MFDKLEDLLIRFEEILGELGEPTVTNNQERFRKLMKEQSDLTPIVDAYKEYKNIDFIPTCSKCGVKYPEKPKDEAFLSIYQDDYFSTNSVIPALTTILNQSTILLMSLG